MALNSNVPRSLRASTASLSDAQREPCTRLLLCEVLRRSIKPLFSASCLSTKYYVLRRRSLTCSHLPSDVPARLSVPAQLPALHAPLSTHPPSNLLTYVYPSLHPSFHSLNTLLAPPRPHSPPSNNSFSAPHIPVSFRSHSGPPYPLFFPSLRRPNPAQTFKSILYLLSKAPTPLPFSALTSKASPNSPPEPPVPIPSALLRPRAQLPRKDDAHQPRRRAPRVSPAGDQRARVAPHVRLTKPASQSRFSANASLSARNCVHVCAQVLAAMHAHSCISVLSLLHRCMRLLAPAPALEQLQIPPRLPFSATRCFVVLGAAGALAVTATSLRARTTARSATGARVRYLPPEMSHAAHV
eukprot:1224460-Pleurochrysis_carterae.AAC.3